MFYDDKEEFLFGNYFEKGKYTGSVNAEESFDKSKNAKNAKINCESCNFYYIDYFFYTTSVHYTSEPVLSFTVVYGICVPCSGGGAPYPVVSGITGSSGGSSNTNNTGPRPHYDPDKTFDLVGSECEAYIRARNLSASYGKEFSGLKVYDADDNRYFWIIFPAEGNNFTQSFWTQPVYGITGDPTTLFQWGESMPIFFQVFLDLSSGTIEPRINFQGVFGSVYTIISTFHTHPNAMGNTNYVVSPDDQTFASNYPNLTHYVLEQNGIRTYNGNGYSDSGHRPCQN
jgi:hypothetical protein